jgi:hypothetical protein
MFLTDVQIETALAAILKQNVSDLPDYEPTILTDAHNSAYNDIASRLVARGFTLAQVNAWDRGAEFEKDIALWWCFDKMAGLSQAVDDRFIGKLDRRAELIDTPVTNGFKPIRPTGGINSVGRGDTDDSASQFFYEVNATGQTARANQDEPATVTQTPW